MKKEKLSTFLLVFFTTTLAQNINENTIQEGIVNDDHERNSKSLYPKSDEENPYEKLCKGGVCVPYYLCDDITSNRTVGNLLDIGNMAECLDYLNVCCATDAVRTEPITPPPPPGADLQSCGLRHPEGVGFSIAGANNSEAEYGEFPWMVAILKVEISDEEDITAYQCGGSLINPTVILTAAHCVKGVPPADLKIRAGEWDTQTRNELFAHSDHDVQDTIVHEHFTPGSLRNDIALLFLTTSVEFEQHISTICLPPQDAFFNQSRCFASGWGKDAFGHEATYQVILKKVELPIVPFQSCQASLRKTRLGNRFNLHQSFICAGGEQGKDLCKGDGGGPLVCPIVGHKGRYYQAGIVSWGIGCGEKGTPGVFVNVSKFRDWIDEQFRLRDLQSNSYIN